MHNKKLNIDCVKKHITWGRTWFRRGYVAPGKRVEGTCGPALKNYGIKDKRRR